MTNVSNESKSDWVQRIEPGRPFWDRPPVQRNWVGRLRFQLRPIRLAMAQARWRMQMRANYYLHGHRPANPCFIVAEGRSGSNLLVDYCRSIPGSFAVEEVFNPKSVIGLRNQWLTPNAPLHHLELSISAPSGTSWCFAKLPATHMRWKGTSYASVRERFSHSRFVILYRQDLAKQYVSWCRLYQTGQERSRVNGQTQEMKITIDAEHFLAFCERVRSTYQAVIQDSTLRQYATLLAYEELAECPQAAFDQKIFPLLGLDSFPIHTSMKRQSQSGLAESIANFDQVREALESPAARLHLALS